MGIKIEDIKLGDKLVSDGTRDCIADGTVVEVFQQDSGLLYVRCNVGMHLLVTDVHGLVPGFYKYREPKYEREEFPRDRFTHHDGE